MPPVRHLKKAPFAASSKCILFVCCFCFSYIANGQELSEKNRALISENIIAYRFRYGQNWELKLLNKQVLTKNTMFFRDLWTSEKTALHIEVSNVKIDYPNNKFHFFYIVLRNLSFPDDTLRDQYHFLFLSGQDYLVGINNITDTPIFLSGDFFLSSYASDFQLDKSKPKSFYDYLYIRYFNMSITNIKFYKIKNKHILFYADFNLQNENRRIIISVNEDNYDEVEYKFKDKFKITM